jgi:hypothetical protein
VLRAVEVVEGARHGVAGDELLFLDERLEQPPADDLEALLGAGRPPRGLDAPDGVAQPVQRRAPALAADLDVVGHRVRRAAVSDAGRLMTSRQCLASLADSVSAWANVKWVSKLPAGRSLWS